MHSTSGAGSGETWAIVLAAGDGTRLHCLTADDSGSFVPKQFCYLHGTSLLFRALMRAAAVVSPERITVIVSATHARHWRRLLPALPASNIVVQPANRGTAIGILLPALRIARRDPNARVVILPSDHLVADERVLEIALRHALRQIARHSRGVSLLGIEADEPDPELGYIVPSRGKRASMADILHFVEKPPVAEARRLCAQGALWNTFIVVCRVASLVELYMSHYSDAVALLQDTDLDDYAALSRVFEALPSADFSRQIATGQEEQLAVVRVPQCGWNDLGTPGRLAKALAQRDNSGPMANTPQFYGEDYVDLAERLLRKRADNAPVRSGDRVNTQDPLHKGDRRSTIR